MMLKISQDELTHLIELSSTERSVHVAFGGYLTEDTDQWCFEEIVKLRSEKHESEVEA